MRYKSESNLRSSVYSKLLYRPVEPAYNEKINKEMEIKELIEQIKEGYQEAELDQLEVWHGSLVTTYAWMAENIGTIKRDRATNELNIKNLLLEKGLKPTEKTIEREFYASPEGQFLAYNEATIKGVGRLLSAIRFKIEALRGNIR